MDPTPEEVARAQAAGAAAAARARQIADDAEPSLLERIEQSGEDAWQSLVTTIELPFSSAASTAKQAGAAASTTFDKVLSAMKWIGIVLLVVVGLLALLFIAAQVFGLVWAGKVLMTIAPDVGKAAVATARVYR